MKIKLIQGHWWSDQTGWGCWIRFFGREGFSISSSKPLFSERMGYRKCFRLLGIKFEYLEKYEE